jgi:hypothetical protein
MIVPICLDMIIVCLRTERRKKPLWMNEIVERGRKVTYFVLILLDSERCQL